VHFVEIDGVDGEDVLRPAGRRSARHGPHRNVVSVTFERIIVFRRSEHMSDIQHFRIQASSLDLVHEWESAVSTERAHDDTREIGWCLASRPCQDRSRMSRLMPSAV
jgi:hypothetical protein